ncbi:MAG: hypothetical protein ABFD16_18300, partial [Thermoguttaceae bacterium]
MKYLRVVILLGVLGWTTPAAWAQYGLYGSPEMVRLPQPRPSMASSVDTYGEAMPRPIDPAAYTAAPLRRPYAAAYTVPSGGPAVQPPNQPLPPAPSPSDAPMPLPPAPSLDQPRATPAVPPPAGLEPIAEPNDGVISKMLQEAGCSNGPVTGPGATCESPFGQAVCDAGPACDAAPILESKKWFATVRSLFMTRNKANRLWTTYETGNNPNQIPTDTDWDWKAGGEVRFGRWFGAGCQAVADCSDCYSTWGGCNPCTPCDTGGAWAVEGVYWTLDSFGDMVSRSIGGGTVSTPLLVDEVFFGADPGTVYFDTAAEHRVWRRSEIHNVELNMIAGQPLLAEGMLNVSWSAGVRYFRFADELAFGSLQNTYTWGADGGTHEAYLRDRITNDLVGGQFGFNASYLLGYNLRLFLNPTFGLYGNHIRNRFQLYRGDGLVATTNPYTGTYPIDSSKEVVSFLTQLDVGLEWQFARNWSANIGYRVLVATGIGLAD